MGMKQTKLDENRCLPDAQDFQKLGIATKDALVKGPTQFNQQTLDEPKDPRSPSNCRTPINLYSLPTKRPAVIERAQTTHSQPQPGNENAFGMLRKRLLKGFSLNDPRSPQLNRTPLIFDEAVDRTLNLDDTFADLFVDSRAPTIFTTDEAGKHEAEPTIAIEALPHNNSSIEIVSLHDEETMPCTSTFSQHEDTMPFHTAILEQSPELTRAKPHTQQQMYDPRSPTIGVDRTPIIFSDDDELHEDQMLEQILETLTLNLSHDSSMASFVSASNDLSFSEERNSKLHEPEPHVIHPEIKPSNKHLERVRFGKHRMPPRKPARASKRQQHQRVQQQQAQVQSIFVDNENKLLLNEGSTPKRSALMSAKNTPTEQKRTPLSCVRNRSHLRSRSVEHTHEKKKSQLLLQCFDDQLNPSEFCNVPNLVIQQNAEGSFNNIATIY